MNISKENINNLAMLSIEKGHHNNGGIIYHYNDEILLKIFQDSIPFYDEIKRNVSYLINNPIPNTVRLFEEVYVDNDFKGYTMKYISDSYTFREAINNNLNMENKIKAIIDIYIALETMHKRNIFLGDIHLDNLLIDKEGRGFIIDLDCLRFPGDENKFKQCYLITPNKESYKLNDVNIYTDNIKMMISSISLLLNEDLENYISSNDHDIKLEEIYKNIIVPLNNKMLCEYFERIMNRENQQYFSDLIISEIKETSKKTLRMVKS